MSQMSITNKEYPPSATIPIENPISRVVRGSKPRRKPMKKAKKKRSRESIARVNHAKRIIADAREPFNAHVYMLKNEGWLNEANMKDEMPRILPTS